MIQNIKEHKETNLQLLRFWENDKVPTKVGVSLSLSHIRYGQYGGQASWIVIRYEKHGRNPSWIVKRYGKYGRKVSWIVKRYEKYGRKARWIVKCFGKYRRKLWNDMENMEEK